MKIRTGEKGAALVIVLLLVATLSFVLLSLTTIVTTGVRRGGNERARTEMLWGAVAAERIAISVLSKASEAGLLQTASNEGGLFSQQLALPVERGTAALRFADASRCFNVNSLIDASSDAVPSIKGRFVNLLTAIGLGDNEAQAIADAVADFLDKDSNVQSQGSEDNFYTGLATPFRTAGGPVASVSELRAIDGVTREIYLRIAPYLCAREVEQTIAININALTPEDAPLIHAATGGAWPVAEIRATIADRPPGGWQTDTTEFWSQFSNPGGIDTSGLADIKPGWVEARVLLEADQRFVEETLIIETPATGEPSLFSRVLGGGD